MGFVAMVSERIVCEGDVGERCLRFLSATPMLMCWCFLARAVGVLDLEKWAWELR